MTAPHPNCASPFVAVDVGYAGGNHSSGGGESPIEKGGSAIAAAVGFATWSSATADAEWTVRIPSVADYVPGSFYLRELPCLLAVLTPDEPPRLPHVRAVIVDGYVWLDGQRPGLGAHLYRALGEETPVIGVAKTAFADAPAVELCRGKSERPLLITAAGMTPEQAANHIGSMHGEFRIPTLLRRVDQLTRSIN